MGVKYVDEFDFSQTSGSEGKTEVRGYMRGGHVKKAKGGTVGVTTERGPKSKRVKSTMTAAAEGGSVHDDLYAAGGKMGYKKGGHVTESDTSGEFVQKSKPQDSMDSGVQPKRRGRNQASVEAGGTKRVKPKFRKGGKVTEHTIGNLGTGGAEEAARAMNTSEERTRSTVKEALAATRKSMHGSATTRDKPPKAAARKAAAPGSQRGKRKHYGLAFSQTPMVK